MFIKLINMKNPNQLICLHCFRMERVNIGSWRGIAKVGGTLMCVSGAVSMALLRGPKLLNSIIIMELGGGDHDQNWLQGCLFLFLSCCLWSIWLILQVRSSLYELDKLIN